MRSVRVYRDAGHLSSEAPFDLLPYVSPSRREYPSSGGHLNNIVEGIKEQCPLHSAALV